MRACLIFIFALFLTVAHARDAKEAFSVPLPEQEWVGQMNLYNSKTHTGLLRLVPKSEHSLLTDESLGLNWHIYTAPPSELKADLIQQEREHCQKFKSRTLLHEGESIAFETISEDGSEKRYSLYYIAHILPFNVMLSYNKENPDDIYELRDRYLKYFKQLKNEASEKGLSVSYKGVQLNNQPVTISEDEQAMAFPHDLFVLTVPSDWKVSQGNKKSSQIMSGHTKALTFVLDRKVDDFETDQILWGLDGKKIAYVIDSIDEETSAFRAKIPGFKRSFYFEAKGKKEDLDDELVMIKQSLKHFSGAWTETH